MDVDEFFQHIGDLGLIQKKIFFLIGLPHVWGAFHVLALTYIGTDPGWKCTAPKTRNSGHIGVAVESLSDPDAKCAYYEQGECLPEFSKEFTSIVTEVGKENGILLLCGCALLMIVPSPLQWDLICSRSYYPNLSQSVYFIGMLIGAWVFGNLSDTYGRKKIYFVSMTGTFFCSFGCSVAPGFYMFSLLRLLLGVFIAGFIVAGYTLLLEVTSTSKRSIVGLAVHFFHPIGYAVLPLLAYCIREWRTLAMVSALFGVVFLSTWR